ncbi:MAG TPA: K(+)-transporting ATPase subunit C [Puia sp.]|jgi:K+-transporting ATPase ATPase C chain|nr:K(+)-transporting ATPase subunit C [Puia sp.]
MKQHILPALRLTLFCVIFFCGIYTFLIWAIARIAPDQGNGQTVSLNGKVVGYALDGQSFTQDKYFWGRPSAVNYNGAGSGGSNKGPSNPDYLKDVQSKIDSFLVHNPGINKTDIPAELVTYSGSGLDPDLSPAGARIQVKRVAAVRGLSGDKVNELVEKSIEQPFLGIFGPARVNVLKLNIALDQLK